MKRIIAALLTVLMLVSCVPVQIFAAETAEKTVPVLTVDGKYASPGQNVSVEVKVSNNTGIFGAILSLEYDSKLTLTEAAAGEAFSELVFTLPGAYTSPCNFVWDGQAEPAAKDGTVLKLTFAVSEEAAANEKLAVNISYENGDVVDGNFDAIEPEIKNGYVNIIDYIPGDVNGDGLINTVDITWLRRFRAGGYDVTINEDAADVNDDDRINTVDISALRRYRAGGYGVELLPHTPRCKHSMQATAANPATCTAVGNIAYWYCTECEKYFSDAVGTTEITLANTVIAATGHNRISYDEVPATSTTEGYTAGVWCDRCETWLHGHEVIPPIAPDESNISYRHWVRKEDPTTGTISIVYDEYLDTHGINNPNPATYEEGTGVAELIEGVPINGEKVSANGYSFLGWYEKPETTAARVYSISKAETGDKILHGVWSKDVYTITYLQDSASSVLPKVEDSYYSVDKEASLNEPPEWSNLVWVGWSDENGKIVKSIPKGTTGDITLTANWMSRRSQTVPNTKYADSKPAIAIDEEKGIYAFTYEIGDIQNVPIQMIDAGADGKGFNLLKGQTHEVNVEFTQKIEQGEATNVADTIANATTKSDAWTLSEDWNQSTTFSEEHTNEVTKEQTEKASQSFTETNKYSLSSGIGGSKEHIDESGMSTKTKSTHEFGVSLNVGAKAGIKAGVTAATPFKNASVEANLGLDYKYSKETEKETHETHTDKSSSYWNVDEGFEKSQSLSALSEFTNSLSQSIRDTYGYSETLDFGGSSSNTVSSSNTSSQSREYASSVTYSIEEGQKYTVVETFSSADTGFYRKVLAANFKVFAVVIYDMKNNTFSTMTHSLKINGSEHLFTDYRYLLQKV